MEPRLTSAMTISALLRIAEGDAGFGTVVLKGDQQSGAIIVVLAERGVPKMGMERILQQDGRYAWTNIEWGAGEEEAKRLIERRRQSDPDLWVLELDVPSAERFADVMKQLD